MESKQRREMKANGGDIKPLAIPILGSICLWLPESMVLDASFGATNGVRSLDTVAYAWFLLAATVAVLFILGTKMQEMQASRKLLLVASVLYSVGLALVLSMTSVDSFASEFLARMVPPAYGQALFLGGVALSGLGFGVLMMAWGSFYIDIPLGKIKAIILLVAVCQPLLAVPMKSFPILLWLLVVMPPLSLACLFRSFDGISRFGREDRRLPAGSVHVKSSYIAGVSSISVCFGALQTMILFNGFSLTLPESLAISGLTVLAVAVVLFVRGASGYSSAWKLIVFAMIVGFALLAVSGGGWLDKAFVVVSLGYGFFEYILWVASVDLAKYSRRPLGFIAWTFVFTIGGQGVGSLLMSGIVSSSNDAQAFLILTATAITVFAAAIIWLLPAGAIKTLFDPTEVKPIDEIRPQSGKCELFKDAYGLTSREAEVAVLLASGRSAKYIQGELVISEGTVWTHIRHVYQKMGVSSRQEFLTVSEELTSR